MRLSLYDFYNSAAIWRIAPATTVAVGEATAKPTARRESAKRRVVGATVHVTPFVAPHTRRMDGYDRSVGCVASLLAHGYRSRWRYAPIISSNVSVKIISLVFTNDV